MKKSGQKEIEKACKTISTRINSLLKTKSKINKEFQTYYKGLKSCINEDITEEQAVSMLSQHLITRPAFDKIFENYEFSENNPVSKTMKKLLSHLDNYGFKNELKDLEKFYQGISRRIEGIDNSASRQKVIKELYENFIKTAFPKIAEKLGVAYTPVEIVDFILRSADEILKDKFGKRLTDEGVHIIDPFVGTGTFLNRLIQMNPVIEKKDLPRKFQKELHANEILLLPYYVASINIEEAYHSRMGGQYEPFPKITLSDIFNRGEKEKQLSLISYFQENNKRIKKQKETDLQVIIGNPPYSSGQKSENDANKNTVYPELRKRIEKTYVKESTTQLNKALYDSYIKAIRWATDEIKDKGKGGIIGFVHNASLVSERSTAGLRKSLVKEFDSIYCLNLRGNQRTKGEMAKKEGGKVFGGSSRTPIAITFLVKKPQKAKTESPVSNTKSLKDQKKPATIKYLDIGDSLSREQKLEKVKDFRCIKGIGQDWETITPDQYGDWINQRDESFYQFMPMGDKKSINQNAIFSLYSQGIVTSRDSWCYNFDKSQVKQNMENMINFYNQELVQIKNKNINIKNMDQFISLDEKKIKWSRNLKNCLLKNKKERFKEENITESTYRPFTKSHLYFSKVFNSEIYQTPKLFPKGNTKNKVICINGIGAKTFSVLMTDILPCFDYLSKTQCFPLYHFDTDSNNKQKPLDLKDVEKGKPTYSITDSALNHFKNHYKRLTNASKNKTLKFSKKNSPDSIAKEDIFYYIYGLLHSEDYREKYKSNLDKSLPRIPLVPQFLEFSSIGRKLSDLHLNYENQPFPKEVKVLKDGKEVDLSCFSFKSQKKNFNLPQGLLPEDLKVQKMKIDKKDKSKIQFNDRLIISGIPKEAWEYKINGYSAPKWIVERYKYKQDKKTDLVNDPNTYSDDPAYILKLLLSVITVSLKTQELIQSLPSIDFDSLTPSMDEAG